MILIGQYDSPYVRRVGIALTLYGFAFEHRPWSTFGEADQIARFNPLSRVPTLVLEDGSVVVESAYVLDWLDERVRDEGREALIPRSGPARRQALYDTGLAMGLSDKVVALFYESVLHEATSAIWLERCRTQVRRSLEVLEARRSPITGAWLSGTLSHADIALGCAVLHARAALTTAMLPGLAWETWPGLIAHAGRCQDLPVFQAVHQPFTGPSGR
ncbi:glutathione S-transferase [Brevundimonas sp. LM2]|uniref:glutathione S-transferase family protein n=1 Tax=Brevundimonas sp. LM2 TaxID=1938605 RepID=UPI000983FB73|nr:glutathione S-transferase family protein [Brevundimonas sp. LM2]AQR61533.1 glutathione S-transferase [Brevundimonas sp. LM2]